jgi:hypothetical protein
VFGGENVEFWIGIGHAGTLISAILFQFRQRWQPSVNRAVESMTLFEVMCAGLLRSLRAPLGQKFRANKMTRTESRR